MNQKDITGSGAVRHLNTVKMQRQSIPFKRIFSIYVFCFFGICYSEVHCRDNGYYYSNGYD